MPDLLDGTAIFIIKPIGRPPLRLWAILSLLPCCSATLLLALLSRLLPLARRVLHAVPVAVGRPPPPQRSLLLGRCRPPLRCPVLAERCHAAEDGNI